MTKHHLWKKIFFRPLFFQLQLAFSKGAEQQGRLQRHSNRPIRRHITIALFPLIHLLLFLLRENTHLFALRGEQLRGNTIIRVKKPSFARKSDSLTIFAF